MRHVLVGDEKAMRSIHVFIGVAQAGFENSLSAE